METITTRRAGGAKVGVIVGVNASVGVVVCVAVGEAVAVSVGACVAVEIGVCEAVCSGKDSPGLLGIWQASRNRIEKRSRIFRHVRECFINILLWEGGL